MVDEKVRYFVAPPIEDIRSTPVRGSVFVYCWNFGKLDQESELS